MRVQTRHSERTVPTHRSAWAFALGCPDRREDDPCSVGTEQLIEGTGELRVAVADQEPRSGAFRNQVAAQVASLVGHPGTAWHCRRPEGRGAARARSCSWTPRDSRIGPRGQAFLNTTHSGGWSFVISAFDDRDARLFLP